MSSPQLRSHLPLPEDLSPLERALNRGLPSARGVDEVLRLAWSVTDLVREGRVSAAPLRVAMQLRQSAPQEMA